MKIEWIKLTHKHIDRTLVVKSIINIKFNGSQYNWKEKSNMAIFKIREVKSI